VDTVGGEAFVLEVVGREAVDAVARNAEAASARDGTGRAWKTVVVTDSDPMTTAEENVRRERRAFVPSLSALPRRP
jgi:hypothetical protein